MADYQKDFAIDKLDIVLRKLEGLQSNELCKLCGESKEDLGQVIELIRKAKEHISNV